MDQDTKQRKKCSVFKQIKYFLTPQTRLDARFLDFMQEHPNLRPNSEPLEAPTNEFQKILAEMDQRGIKPTISRQVKVRGYFRSAGQFARKPIVAALLVVLILGGTSAGVSAKKAYDYRMREREVGKSNIVWNNDQDVLTIEDGLDKAYGKIAEELKIKPLRLMAMPFTMTYDGIEISDGNATLKFIYNDRSIFFMQAKKEIASSNNVVSDRSKGSEIYNRWLGQTIVVEGNELSENVIEYSSYLNLNGAYYYLSGIMNKEEFIAIINNLSF